jgi:aspartate aminotransferase-like enzyme
MTEETPPIRFFCPGPVWVPARILGVLAEPIHHHRTEAFREVMGETRTRLRRLWGAPDWEPMLFSCTGTGVMDGAVSNFMRRGSKALTVSAGKFGERWAHALRAYGCEAIELKLPWGKSVDPDDVLKLLRAHPDIRAIYLTSADTSAGVEHDLETLGPAIRAETDALIVIDAICDFGGAREVRPLDWGADIAISCSQKCLTTPPGLGLATVGPRAWKFNATADLPRFYFDWRKEYERQRTKDLTAFTSSVSLVRGLCESLRMIEEEGLPQVVERYARVGNAVREGVQALGFSLLAESPTNGVTAIRCPDKGGEVVEHMWERFGYRIAHGQDPHRGQMFRLGHMGSFSKTDILELMNALAQTCGELKLTSASPADAMAAAEKHL